MAYELKITSGGRTGKRGWPTTKRLRTSRTSRSSFALALTLLGIAFFWQTRRLEPIETALVPLERVGIKFQASRSEQGSSGKEDNGRFSSRLPFEPRTGLPPAQASGRLEASVSRNTDDWRELAVGPGDSLSLVFGRLGANPSDLHEVLKCKGPYRNALTKLLPGEIVRVRSDGAKLVEVVLEKDPFRAYRFVRGEGGFTPELVESKPEIRVATAVASINHSLFLDGQKAGLTDRTIVEFVNIFGWDVDFLRDLQRGDRFSVIFEELYKDGEKISNGRILAAEFVTGGKRLRAIHYENEDGISGYYSDKGDAMRKAFLRTPVNFTRISSRFSLARKHPILNRIRAHKGVDYSAPTGTPIQSVADGKVVFAGWRGGYGNVVQIKHANGYSTLYGHMSKFARGIRTGASVNQAQTIGYVGRTGLATGPHLHYEFLVGGIHHDPLTVKLPNSLPLERRYLDDFLAHAAPTVRQLEVLGRSADQENREREMVAGLPENRGKQRRVGVN